MKIAGALILCLAFAAPASAAEQSRPPVQLAQTTQSCAQEIGAKEAATLVDECTQVSPATHPPCNADNACDLITDEIQRGCAMLSGKDKPAFCAGYEGD